MSLRTGALVLLVVGALLACKKKKSAPPADPSLAPDAVLALAASDAGFEEREIRVAGKVIAVRPGGETVPPFVDLEASGGKKLAAGMRSYQCLKGLCFEEPPAVGSQATMKCVGVLLGGQPLVARCEKVKR